MTLSPSLAADANLELNLETSSENTPFTPESETDTELETELDDEENSFEADDLEPTIESSFFAGLGLPPAVLEALKDLNYLQPTPIQSQTIPLLMQGRDVLGQAQTGTGKTAAFALPILHRTAIELNHPQTLILAPTRELAIQVAEALQSYAKHLKGFRALAIYGGQSYEIQLRGLKRGPHVVVATPGRLIDHMERGTIDLRSIETLVLDEADEMLRMGFIEDLEKILQQVPAERQTALFSATMPREIRRLAQNYLKDPAEIKIQLKTQTAETIRQRYWLVRGIEKIDALTRLLESEPTDGVLIFVRTKSSTQELADQLALKGYHASALNGDMAQALRERTVEHLRQGRLDILVATDVAARGLDIERVSHVINYDIPFDSESYIHRIGRTGRAGRSGDAILFVMPRERRMLQNIERVVGKSIDMMELPSAAQINQQRVARFKQRITDTLQNPAMGFFRGLIDDYAKEQEKPMLEVASALAVLLQGKTPLLMSEDVVIPDLPPQRERRSRGEGRGAKGRGSDEGLVSYRVEVGRQNQLKPSQLVGAIANEGGLDSSYIGRISLYDRFTTVDLPESMEAHLMRALKKTRINGQMLNLSRAQDGDRSERSGYKSRSERSERSEYVPRGRRSESASEYRSERSEKSGYVPRSKQTEARVEYTAPAENISSESKPAKRVTKTERQETLKQSFEKTDVELILEQRAKSRAKSKSALTETDFAEAPKRSKRSDKTFEKAKAPKSFKKSDKASKSSDPKSSRIKKSFLDKETVTAGKAGKSKDTKRKLPKLSAMDKPKRSKDDKLSLWKEWLD